MKKLILGLIIIVKVFAATQIINISPNLTSLHSLIEKEVKIKQTPPEKGKIDADVILFPNFLNIKVHYHSNNEIFMTKTEGKERIKKYVIDNLVILIELFLILIIVITAAFFKIDILTTFLLLITITPFITIAIAYNTYKITNEKIIPYQLAQRTIDYDYYQNGKKIAFFEEKDYFDYLLEKNVTKEYLLDIKDFLKDLKKFSGEKVKTDLIKAVEGKNCILLVKSLKPEIRKIAFNKNKKLICKDNNNSIKAYINSILPLNIDKNNQVYLVKIKYKQN